MTETEIERLVVRLVGDGSSYQKMLKDAEANSKAAAVAVEEAANKIEGIGDAVKGFGGAVVGMFASWGVKEWLSQGKDEWRAYETVLFRVKSALQANGRQVDATLEKYVQFAEIIQKTTTLSDDEALSLLKQAEMFDLTGDAAIRAAKQAMALGAAVDAPASSLMRMSAAMADGNVAQAKLFARMVPQLRGAKDEAEFLAKYTRLVASGQLTLNKEILTGEGRAKQFKNLYADMMKDIGKIVDKAVVPFEKVIKKFVGEWFRDLSTEAKTFIVVSAGTVASIIALVGVLGTLRPALALAKAGVALLRAELLLLATNPYVWVTAAAAAFALLGREIYKSDEGVQALGRSLAKAEKLHDVVGKALAKRTADFMEGLPEKETERMAKVREGIAETEKSLKSYEAQIYRNKKIQEITGPDYPQDLGDAANLMTINEQVRQAAKLLANLQDTANREGVADELKQASQRADDARNRLELLRAEHAKLVENARMAAVAKSVEKYTQEMKHAADVVGLSHHEQSRLKLVTEGATDAMLAEADAWAQVREEAEKGKKANDDLKELEESLKEQIAAHGKSSESAKIHKLATAGLSDEQLKSARAMSEQLDEMKEVERVVKESRTPLDKFSDEMAKLNRLYEKGAISGEVYGQAVEKAEKALDDATKKAKEAKHEIKALDAALYGSAEAASRLFAYRQSISRGVAQRFATPRAVEEVQTTVQTEAQRAAQARNNPNLFRPDWGAVQNAQDAAREAARLPRAAGFGQDRPAPVYNTAPGVEILKDIRDDGRKRDKKPDIKIDPAGLV